MLLNYYGFYPGFLADAFFNEFGEVNLDILSVSSTQAVLEQLDSGIITTLTGTNFAVDGTGSPTGGTITGISFETSGSNTIAEISGISWSLVAFDEALAALEQDNDPVPMSDLFDSSGAITVDASGANQPLDMTDWEDLLPHISNSVNVTGTNSADDILGGAGRDSLDGGDGFDFIFGGNGQDTLIGGAGDDEMIGGDSENDLRDVMYGGDGADYMDGNYGNDELRGDAGNDTLIGGFGADTVLGGDGDDNLTAQAWGDLLFGGDGNDFINGGFGYDRVNGGTGADAFFHLGVAGHGSDWIQDFDSTEGDYLLYGGTATADQFQINYADTENAGEAGISEAFIIYRPTGQILWALVDGGGQEEINLMIGSTLYDLMA